MANHNKSVIKIIQVNVNSLVSLAKRHEFSTFLKTHKPDIVLVCETKLNNKHKIGFEGYKFYRNDRESSGGGTAICVHEKIKSEYLSTPTNITSIECCSVKVIIKDNKKLIISSIYKPPKNKFNIDELTSLVNLDKNANHVIAGDFNAHHFKWGSDYCCTNGLIIYDWYECNRNALDIKLISSENPTCYRTVKGSHIDFGFIIGSGIIVDNENIDKLNSVPFSDHAATIFEICAEPMKIEPVVVKNYSKANWNQIKNYVETQTDNLKIPTNTNLTK